MAPKKKPQSPWEVAKPILKKDYLDGKVTDSMKPSYVWKTRPEFEAVKHTNFRNNFATLKRGIRANRQRADDDAAGFLHDMALCTLAKDTDGCWDGSEAQKLLWNDIDKKLHEQMKPKILWRTRPEYQQCPLTKFRGHIHQELRSSRETNCWIVKKKKKKNLKAKGSKLNEDDVDFLYDPVLDLQINQKDATLITCMQN